jgi:hypothetical protein
MKTATEALDAVDKHTANLLLTRDGHAGMLHILSSLRQQAQAESAEKIAAETAAAESAGGPG